MWLGWLAVPLAYAEEWSLQVGGHAIRAEIADNRAAHERGLMGRTHLCKDCGMLFVFREPGNYGFWMKGTPLPLAIAFIDADGRILNIEEMQPDTLDVHYPQGLALYVLELNRGWFARHGVKPGDKVKGVGRSRQGGAAHSK